MSRDTDIVLRIFPSHDIGAVKFSLSVFLMLMIVAEQTQHFPVTAILWVIAVVVYLA